MNEELTITPLEGKAGIYVLLDSRGNLMSAGSLELLEILLCLSKRCVRAMADPESAITPVQS